MQTSWLAVLNDVCSGWIDNLQKLSGCIKKRGKKCAKNTNIFLKLLETRRHPLSRPPLNLSCTLPINKQRSSSLFSKHGILTSAVQRCYVKTVMCLKRLDTKWQKNKILCECGYRFRSDLEKRWNSETILIRNALQSSLGKRCCQNKRNWISQV